MVKSATVDRDAQPVKVAGKLEKLANKPAGRLEKQGGPRGPGTENLVSRTVDFLKDVRSEMRKVVTPSREEVRTMTTVVILTVFAFAAFFYVADGILGRLVQALFRWLGGTR